MVVPQSSINNIMGGIESTGGVRLHNHRRKLKQRFDIVRKLGQGNYGKVQLGINKETGQEVAIKTIKKCKIETEADLIRIRREIQIMSSVRHPNIIHIYEVFENREKMVLVMEYAAGGELYDFLDQKKVLTEEEARRIFRQIATAVYYCHKHKICHRDLKLENILLDENENAKIADFGLSNVFTESRLLSTFCGSPLYASPEIVKGIPYHGPEVDCWSLGVLLYTLVYGAMPFDGSNFKRLVKQISNGDYFEPKNKSSASPLIGEMLNVDPEKRADISVICSHWWIDKDYDVPCLNQAEELANQTPVRLDLLLSLAPSPSTDKIVVGADPVPAVPSPEPTPQDRPLRSQSLCNIPPTMKESVPRPRPEKIEEKLESVPNSTSGVKMKDPSSTAVNKAKRDPSSSTLKKKEGDKENLENNKQDKVVSDKPKVMTLEEPKPTVQEPITPVAEMPPPSDNESVAEEVYPDERAVETLIPNTADPVVFEPITPEPIPEVKSANEENIQENKSKPTERRRSSVLETVEKFNKQPAPPKKIIIPGSKIGTVKNPYERKASSSNLVSSPSRKSIIEAPKEDSVPKQQSQKDMAFCLASTVNVNKLAEQALSSPEIDTNVVQPPPLLPSISNKVKASDESVDKSLMKKNAVKVIGNAIGGSSDSLDKNKSSTLPRRKSKPEFVQPLPFIVPMPNKPSHELKNEVRHIVNPPPSHKLSQVVFPVSAKPATRQVTQPLERIIPIQFEQDVVPSASTPSVPTPQTAPVRKSSSQQSQQNISRTSSRSFSRQSTHSDSDSSICSSGDPIRKSAHEVIIPIAVEGGGYVTPSATALNNINSITESEDDGSTSSPRCFTLRSTRRRQAPQTKPLEAVESISSDEDDDNFEILTAENLFSTLLSRVRSLTQRLNTDEHRSDFPRSIFTGHSLFENHPRFSDSRSFSRVGDIHPWRRSLSREPSATNASSSTLPRDRSKSSHRNATTSQLSRDEQLSPSPSAYRSRLRPPVTIKNSLSKQLLKERMNEVDGIDTPKETKLKSRHNGSHNLIDPNLTENHTKPEVIEPYVYRMRTRQRTNSIVSPTEISDKPQFSYKMRTRSRGSGDTLNTEGDAPEFMKKRPISIHESFDTSKLDSGAGRRPYQRSFSCDRTKVNAVLNDAAKILEDFDDNRPVKPTTTFRRTNSLRQPTNFDRDRSYRRSLSANTSYGSGEGSVLDRYSPISNSKISRFVKPNIYEKSDPSPPSRYSLISDVSSRDRSAREPSLGPGPEPSRIKSTIQSLRESSIGPDSIFDSESNLLKRAISLESEKQSVGRSKNIYKDFMSKIVSSRDGTLNGGGRSQFGQRSELQRTNSKTWDRNNTTAPNTERDTIAETETDRQRIESGDTEFSKPNKAPESKLPTRLIPNSETVLLKNRRYSIPRFQTQSKSKIQPNSASKNGDCELRNGGGNRDVGEDGPLDTVEKLINNLENARTRRAGSISLESMRKSTDNSNRDSTSNQSSQSNNLDASVDLRSESNTFDSAKNQRAESISKLKRLDLSSNSNDISERPSKSRSLNNCDSSSRLSFLSPTTEDSDGWSICSDSTDAKRDCPSPSSPSSTHEETVSERIRRKSFFSRFNPRRNSSSGPPKFNTLGRVQSLENACPESSRRFSYIKTARSTSNS